VSAVPRPTAEQQAVIDHQDGTLVVLAAVGSGKTTTLGRRIARALQPPDLPDAGTMRPERVLALTFTNRAARHMRDSLERVVDPELAGQVCLSTFHGLCARILRTAPEEAGLPSDFRILDEDDAQEILEELQPEGGARDAFYALAEAASQAPLGSCTTAAWHSGALLSTPWAAAYARSLQERGAVDFAGLVYLTRAVLTAPGAPQDRWRTAFDLVQVDEVQDTHMSEYEVLRVLASGARSLCLVGDLDQTIYSWRGSAPRELLDALDRDFPPVRTLSLTRCFRATRRVLAVANALASGLSERTAAAVAAESRPDGEVPVLMGHPTARHEREAVCAQAARLVASGVPAEELAVLVRTNKEISRLSEVFQARGLPCATVEQFGFFRRQEVKDALSLARLVHARHDEHHARRAASRLVQGVGRVTIQRIVSAGRDWGLRLSDLMDSRTVEHGDPLWVLQADEVIVLDTETTGLDPQVDEVIEVAAVRLRNGEWSGAPADTFSCLLRNTVPVGDSESTHKISDAQLQQAGRPPAEALQELRSFIGTAPIAGHNLPFDRRMLEAYGARIGVPLALTEQFDTLDCARRLIPRGPHKLEALIERLGLQDVQNSHRALDDVKATVALASALRQLAQRHASQRRALIEKEAPAFARLRTALDRWRDLGERPHNLIRRIAQEALGPKMRRLRDHAARMANLTRLVNEVRAKDIPLFSPDLALEPVLDEVALNQGIDALEAGRVRILTMHQSKGLEFDHVFVPGLHDGGLPAWWVLRSEDEDGIQEELRLLYVAATRARVGLHLSWAAKGDRGHDQRPSRFFDTVPPDVLRRRRG
jgi:DNA helicase-2/ATP-dependent DNA helicase PcrA